MSVLDRSKVRPDILKLLRESNRVQTRGMFKFARRHPHPSIKLEVLLKKVMKTNVKFFKGELTKEAASEVLSEEEQVYLARVIRFALDFSAKQIQRKNPILEGIIMEYVDINGIPGEWNYIAEANEEQILYYLHGGGYVLGSTASHRLLTACLAKQTGMKVLSIDYRLAPENRFPAALEDSVECYEWLLSNGIKAKDIIIAGDSAGGNLTLTTLLKLKREGITLPKGAIAISPIVDYTLSSESFMKNAQTDPILAEIGLFWWLSAYIGDRDETNPLISPIFGDLDGLPPLLFQASTCEMLYDDSVRFVKKAKKNGVNVRLQTWDEMPHVFQLFGINELSESKEAINKIVKFIEDL